MGQQIRPVEKLIFCSALLLIFARLTHTSADPDLWGYLAFGRFYLQNHQFPFQDPFSYLPTQPSWVYHEWLTGTLYYALFSKFGFAALQLLKYCLGLGTALLIFFGARTKGASFLFSSIGLILISPLFAVSYSPVRAQIFTNFFLALNLLAIVYAHKQKNYLQLFLLLPLNWCWINMHGGFVAGLGLYLLFALDGLLAGQTKNYLPGLAFLGFLALSFLTPYGLSYWHGIILELSVKRPDIPEWSSVATSIVSAEYLAGTLIFLGVLLAAIALLAKFKSLYTYECLLLLGMALQGLLHVRHQALFYLVAGFFVPGLLEHGWTEVSPQLSSLTKSKLFKSFLPGALCTLTIILFGKALVSSPLSIESSQDFPEKAIQFLNRGIAPGRILTELDWGSYVTWELFPKTKVAIDGRYTTVFEPSQLTQFFDFIYARGDALGILKSFKHEAALLRADSLASDLLSKTPGWKMIYRDNLSRVFLADALSN